MGTFGDMKTFLNASGRRLTPTANIRKPRPGAYIRGVNLHSRRKSGTARACTIEMCCLCRIDLNERKIVSPECTHHVNDGGTNLRMSHMTVRLAIRKERGGSRSPGDPGRDAEDSFLTQERDSNSQC